MSLKFPKLRCVCFIVVLVGLLLLSHLYKEKLLVKTHDATLNLQKDEDPDSFKFDFFH